MGEHKLPPNLLKKKRWDALRGVDLGHHRYVWRSSTQGTFRYPKEIYGALQSRREFKRARKFAKRLSLRGAERRELMLNIMGIDE